LLFCCRMTFLSTSIQFSRLIFISDKTRPPPPTRAQNLRICPKLSALDTIVLHEISPQLWNIRKVDKHDASAIDVSLEGTYWATVTDTVGSRHHPNIQQSAWHPKRGVVQSSAARCWAKTEITWIKDSERETLNVRRCLASECPTLNLYLKVHCQSKVQPQMTVSYSNVIVPQPAWHDMNRQMSRYFISNIFRHN
jgi:hypothetical protein